jgi:hypothetical protein
MEAYTRGEVVTLLFAERDEDHNGAVAQREYLDKWLKREFRRTMNDRHFLPTD